MSEEMRSHIADHGIQVRGGQLGFQVGPGPSAARRMLDGGYQALLVVMLVIVVGERGWDWFSILLVALLGGGWLLGAPAKFERLRHPAPTDRFVPIDASLMSRVEALQADGQRVAAVKLVRESTGLGLRDAVAVVDAADSPELVAGV